MDLTYRLPATLQADLQKLREETERFAAGDISATEYRACRVPQGVYEQRQDGTYMLRVRIPTGGVFPHQMRKLAVVARKYGSGRLHLTTRQDIQVHDVQLDGIYPALIDLFSSGLSTRGGGGNTVRNVIVCPDAGVCPDELFNIAPHCVAMTEFMLSDPLSFQLPRKYKIGFSGCSADCVGATVNDLAFIAKTKHGEHGFSVHVGGGMGPHARVAQPLEDFVAESDIHLVAEAVKRVFDKYGNRKNKHKARLRYLVEQKGIAAFKELYQVELSALRESGVAPLETRELPGRNGSTRPAAVTPAPGFDTWREMNVRPQKQEGYHFAHVPIFLGDIDADDFEKLAGVVEGFGQGVLHTTLSQNLLVRGVSQVELPGLHRGLSGLEMASARSPVEREMIACTGAATCRLGICLSQGLARAVRDELAKADLDLAEAEELRLYMNGCPNACGRHPIGSIALFGAARRVEGRLVPYYILQLGGRVGEGTTRLASGKEALPAHAVPRYLVELLSTFRKSQEYPDFDAFLDCGGRELAAEIASTYKDVPPFASDKNYYYDWDAEELFSFAGRGAGECSAGVFDLINVDLASARQALEEGKLLPAVTAAARTLLITRGEQARDGGDALRLFEEHFVETGLVDGSIRKLIADARSSMRTMDTANASGVPPFNPATENVAALVSAVASLYENMDQSLRFKAVCATADGTMTCCAPPAETSKAQAKPSAPAEPPAAARATCGCPDSSADPSPAAGAGSSADIRIDREADFQGVTCPLNYVKTKLLLGQMKQGQVLSVLLDQAGGKSVPRSAEKDGHEVLLEETQDDRWRVVIRKA